MNFPTTQVVIISITVQTWNLLCFFSGIQSCLTNTVFPGGGPGGAYGPEAGMGYMMDGQQMVHRPPDAPFHNEAYHYPPQYYGHL